MENKMTKYSSIKRLIRPLAFFTGLMALVGGCSKMTEDLSYKNEQILNYENRTNFTLPFIQVKKSDGSIVKFKCAQYDNLNRLMDDSECNSDNLTRVEFDNAYSGEKTEFSFLDNNISSADWSKLNAGFQKYVALRNEYREEAKNKLITKITGSEENEDGEQK
ncbi:hypothetical protein J4474_00885 [Candidatus Pacearchaeota archaeon]|nr:hypothetical protein [Candidatus Pacearchaeota archaeon]